MKPQEEEHDAEVLAEVIEERELLTLAEEGLQNARRHHGKKKRIN